MTQRNFDHKPSHDEVSHLRPFPADLRSTDERVERLVRAEMDSAPLGIEDRVFSASVRKLPKRSQGLSFSIVPRLLPLAAAVALVGVGVWIAIPAVQRAPTGGVAIQDPATPESVEADLEAWLAAAETHEDLSDLDEALAGYDAALGGDFADDAWADLTEDM